MSNSRSPVYQIAFAGVVGGLYALLSYFAAVFGVAYGPLQFRFSEALCLLPFLFPATVPGLFIGCLVANLLSPYGALDVVFGSLATLLAAYLTSKCPNKWLAPLPPVVCNGVIVGGLIAFSETGLGPAFPAAFAYNGLTLAVGEAAVCYVLGLLLLSTLSRLPILRPLMARSLTTRP